jgi:hypothetical protein
MSGMRRNNFTGDVKAKVALKVPRGIKTINVVAKSFRYSQRKLVCLKLWPFYRP